MAVSMIGPKFYAWDRNGKPLAGGKLYTYQARTNTPKATYQSEDAVVENANPVILNGEGYANVYLVGSYKMVLKDSKDNEIWSSDPVSANEATEWGNCLSATYLSPTSFSVAGNFVDKYEPGRKIRINNNAIEYAYSLIETSVYAAGVTTITVKDAVVTTGLSEVCLSIVSENSVPEIDAAKITTENGGTAQDQFNFKNGLTTQEAINYVGVADLLGSRVWLTDRNTWAIVVLTSVFTPDGKEVIQSASNINFSFYIEKSNVYSSQNLGESTGELGRNLTTDPLIAARRDDFDFLRYGNVSISKRGHGVRRNGCVISARLNAPDQGAFQPQIAGVSDTVGLANYGNVDSVAVFADAQSLDYESWEQVVSPSYSGDGFTATGLDFDKIKVGMIIETNHTAPWVAFVSDTDENINKVIVTEWVQRGASSPSTPTDDEGLKFNPETKIWAFNFNTVLNEDARASEAVIGELGFINNKIPDPTSLNCLDIVLLEQSTYGATSGVYIHAAGDAKFKYSYLADGASISNYYSRNGVRGYVSRNDDIGFIYSVLEDGVNKTAFGVVEEGTGIDGAFLFEIGGDGRIHRAPYRTQTITDGLTMPINTTQFVYGGTGTISATLPTASTLRDGDVIFIMVVRTSGTVNVSGNITDGSGGQTTKALTGSREYKCVYVGGSWLITDN